MPFGAHETMEVHEILNEKINMIQHLNLYASMVQSGPLADMIQRHLLTAVGTYNQLAAYTHDYQAANGNPAAMGLSMPSRPDQVQYGLNQPAPVAPMVQGTLNEQQVLAAMLSAHKNSAKLQMQACLECADPNVRRMLLQGANLCADFAYEVFFLMNQQGLYQVPTMNDHTAKTFLHTYQQVPSYPV